MGVRPEHVISTIQSAQVTVLYRAKLVNRTGRVLLYIPNVISLSGWLLRGDAMQVRFNIEFLNLVSNVSMELNNRDRRISNSITLEVPCCLCEGSVQTPN